MPEFGIDLEREIDGRWIAEIGTLPGALVYRTTRAEATRKVKELALRILAERRTTEKPLR